MPTADDMRQAFMADIIANPERDDVRLIFADWLDDHGEPERAEFIRVQCEYATLNDVDRTCPYLDSNFANRTTCRWKEGVCQCRGCALVKQEDELIRFNASRWIDAALAEEWQEGFGTWRRPLLKVARIVSKRSVCRELEFRRGFVAEIHCPLAAWLAHGGAIVRSQPIEVVRLTDREPYDHHGYFVWADGEHDDYPSCGLPSEIFALLPPHDDRLSREAAFDRLSRACLLWARKEPR